MGIIPGVSNWFRTYGFADIEPGLVIGAYPLDADDVGMLEWLGINRVLNLVEDEEYRPGERDAVETALTRAEIEEYRLSLTDYGGLPPAALEAAVQEISQWLDEGRRTYVHCRAGWQRSAAVAAGVVAVRKGARDRRGARLRPGAEAECVAAAAPAWRICTRGGGGGVGRAGPAARLARAVTVARVAAPARVAARVAVARPPVAVAPPPVAVAARVAVAAAARPARARLVRRPQTPRSDLVGARDVVER